jgi:hypothetical protein
MPSSFRSASNLTWPEVVADDLSQPVGERGADKGKMMKAPMPRKKWCPKENEHFLDAFIRSVQFYFIFCRMLSIDLIEDRAKHN